MSSVTQRIGEIKQPKGGYIKPSQFKKTCFDDGVVLNENENVHASVIGLTVDYMTRYMMTGNASEAFRISIRGYYRRLEFYAATLSDRDAKKSDIFKKNKSMSLEEVKERIVIEEDGDNSIFRLLERLNGLDDDSIIAACKITTYDVWLRSFITADRVKTAYGTNPDKQTIENIRVMIQRSLLFWERVRPITADGFVFSEINKDDNSIKSGYTATVDTGDGDYLTNDTMWDFKVSKSEITNRYTLQILMYYIMGKHSGMDMYKNINRLGFFNPRLNAMYELDVNTIPEEIIKAVETDVIGY